MIRKYNTAIFFVVYPGCEIFFPDFIDSLKGQTCLDFDLVIVNDGLDNNLLSELQFNKIVIKGVLSISKNREIGINTAKKLGYDYLILCDIDDFFHSTRVEKTLEGLKIYDCVVNDLNIVSSVGKVMCLDYFQQSHKIPSVLPNDYLDEKNICGFSNTGISLHQISYQKIPEDLKIVDWFLFSNLIKSCKIGFINEALTNYRQHGSNMIGIDDFTIDLFKKLLPHKIRHYYLLKEIDPKYEKFFTNYSKMLNSPDEEIAKSIYKNKQFVKYPLWWENIKI